MIVPKPRLGESEPRVSKAVAQFGNIPSATPGPEKGT
jgi:hypothetical protein